MARCCLWLMSICPLPISTRLKKAPAGTSDAAARKHRRPTRSNRQTDGRPTDRQLSLHRTSLGSVSFAFYHFFFCTNFLSFCLGLCTFSQATLVYLFSSPISLFLSIFLSYRILSRIFFQSLSVLITFLLFLSLTISFSLYLLMLPLFIPLFLTLRSVHLFFQNPILPGGKIHTRYGQTRAVLTPVCLLPVRTRENV